MSSIKNFIKGLIYENGSPSRTGIISLLFAISFLVGSAYLIINGISWSHYETFSLVTSGGGIGGALGNKFINSTKNSDIGKFPDK